MKRRNTKQRQVIYDALMHTDAHPNAYEVYETVKQHIPDISLGTVYRNLNLLVDEGLVNRLDLGEDNVRFDGNISDHHHFICKNCGKIIDIHEKLMIPVKETEANYHFQIDSTEMIFHGLCSTCVNDHEEEELWN